MTNPLSWSTTAASNTSVAGVSIAEGWAPASVNNALRGMMADLSKYIKDASGDLVTFGAGLNAYNIASNMALTAYAKPILLMARAHVSNTGPSSLSVDGLGARSIRRTNGAVIAAGDIVLGGLYFLSYEPVSDVFMLLNPTGIGVYNSTVPVAFGGTGITSYAAGDLLYAATATTMARLAAATTGNVLVSGTFPSWGKVALAATVSGILPVANGGTGAGDATNARLNLGLVIGTNIQAFDATLAGIASLTTAANQAIYSTGVDTFATTGLSVYGRSLIDDADATAARTTLGLGTMATQAASAVAITGGSIDVPTLKVSGVAVPTQSTANIWTAAQTVTMATAAAVPLTLTSTEAGAAVGPTLNLFRDSVSPFTADIVGAVTFTGRNSANAVIGYGSIQSALTDVTSGSEDGRINVATVINGSSTIVAQFGPGLVVGNPTGGDKGVGTVNATGVYDDNTLLTGYVLEGAIDGSIDRAKWDKIGIRGVHEPMRRFFKMTQSEDEDPYAIDNYVRYWKRHRHLPSLPDEDQPTLMDMPSTGQWIQMLVETVEIFACHIHVLNERLKLVEPMQVEFD